MVAILKFVTACLGQFLSLQTKNLLFYQAVYIWDQEKHTKFGLPQKSGAGRSINYQKEISA